MILAGMLCASRAHAIPSCHALTAATVPFGNYDVFNNAQTVVPGTIGYVCPPPTVAAVTIDAGLHPTSGKRAMQITTGGTDLLLYDLFHDATCLVRWDPTLSSPVIAGSGNIAFYACMAGGQDVSAGPYSDTITVTFNF